MLQGIQQSPLFEKKKKDCAAEGIEVPKEIIAQYPRTHVLTPKDYLKNVEAGIMPPMRNHNVLKELGKKVRREQSDLLHNDGVLGSKMPEPIENTESAKTQVSSIALQTDSCSMLYMTKETLVAYTIAVVQNTQTLQYEQMQVALKTAQNQASLETPIRA